MNATATVQPLMDNLTPQRIASTLSGAEAPRDTPKSYTNTSRGKSKKKTIVEAAATVKKSTRPLNSYMAFRSYYSTLFSGVQQKDISGIVTYLWQADPYKAKWTVLAKAYSAIRDVQGKPEAPLHEFLAMNTSFVGIIKPEQYLEALGWRLRAEDDGHVTIAKEEPSIDTDVASPSVTVNGVIQNCYMQGYYTGRLSDVVLTNDQTAFTIGNADTPNWEATGLLAEPNSQAHNEGSGVHHDPTTVGTGDQKIPGEYESVDQIVEAQAGQSRVLAPESPITAGHDHDAQEHISGDSHTSALNVPINTTTELVTTVAFAAALPSHRTEAPSEHVTVGKAIVPQSTISSAWAEPLSPADFRLPQGELALYEAFDPLLYQEHPIFVPFAGNQFDAFDWMDGWDEYMRGQASTSESRSDYNPSAHINSSL